MKYITDILLIAGAVSVTTGATFMSLALGCVVAGFFMLGFAALIALSRGQVKKDSNNVA